MNVTLDCVRSKSNITQYPRVEKKFSEVGNIARKIENPRKQFLECYRKVIGCPSRTYGTHSERAPGAVIVRNPNVKSN